MSRRASTRRGHTVGLPSEGAANRGPWGSDLRAGQRRQPANRPEATKVIAGGTLGPDRSLVACTSDQWIKSAVPTGSCWQSCPSSGRYWAIRLSEKDRRKLGRTPWGLPSALWAFLVPLADLGPGSLSDRPRRRCARAQQNFPVGRRGRRDPLLLAPARHRGASPTVAEQFPPIRSRPTSSPDPTGPRRATTELPATSRPGASPGPGPRPIGPLAAGLAS